MKTKRKPRSRLARVFDNRTGVAVGSNNFTRPSDLILQNKGEDLALVRSPGRWPFRNPVQQGTMVGSGR